MTLNYTIFAVNGRIVFRIFSKMTPWMNFNRQFTLRYNNLVQWDVRIVSTGEITIIWDEATCTHASDTAMFYQLAKNHFDDDIFHALSVLTGTSLLDWEINNENSGSEGLLRLGDGSGVG